MSAVNLLPKAKLAAKGFRDRLPGFDDFAAPAIGAMVTLQVLVVWYTQKAKDPDQTTILPGVSDSTIDKMTFVLPILNAAALLMTKALAYFGDEKWVAIVIGLTWIAALVTNVVFSLNLFTSKNEDGTNKVKGVDVLVPWSMLGICFFMMFAGLGGAIKKFVISLNPVLSAMSQTMSSV